jgi:hypothetical protein
MGAFFARSQREHNYSSSYCRFEIPIGLTQNFKEVYKTRALSALNEWITPAVSAKNRE